MTTIEMSTTIVFEADRQTFDDALYVIKESLEYDNNVTIDDDRYERILDEVMIIEDVDDYGEYDELKYAVSNMNPLDLDDQLDEIREAYDHLIRAMLEITVEAMVDAGDFE